MKKLLCFILVILFAATPLFAWVRLTESKYNETKWNGGHCELCGARYKKIGIQESTRENVIVHVYECERCGYCIKLTEEP